MLSKIVNTVKEVIFDQAALLMNPRAGSTDINFINSPNRRSFLNLEAPRTLFELLAQDRYFHKMLDLNRTNVLVRMAVVEDRLIATLHRLEYEKHGFVDKLHNPHWLNHGVAHVVIDEDEKVHQIIDERSFREDLRYDAYEQFASYERYLTPAELNIVLTVCSRTFVKYRN